MLRRRRLEWGLGSDDGLFSCTGTIVHDVDGKVCFPNVCAAPSDWDFEYDPMHDEAPYRHHGYHTGFCANKVDKPRKVSEAEGQKWAAQRNFDYFETSAYSGANIAEVFECVFRKALARTR